MCMRKFTGVAKKAKGVCKCVDFLFYCFTFLSSVRMNVALYACDRVLPLTSELLTGFIFLIADQALLLNMCHRGRNLQECYNTIYI